MLIVSLPIAYCLLPIAYCLLPIAYCLLPIAYCLLLIAYCLLLIAYCLLFSDFIDSSYFGLLTDVVSATSSSNNPESIHILFKSR